MFSFLVYTEKTPHTKTYLLELFHLSYFSFSKTSLLQNVHLG